MDDYSVRKRVRNYPNAVSAVGGLGDLTAVPSGTTNGAALGTMPTLAVGARIYLASADSVTFTIASTAPTGAPSLTITVAGSSAPVWDENLYSGQMIYITAKSGSPVFRWY